MNCHDMMQMAELREVLNLRAGEKGLGRSIRWIYFADCLQCIRSEFRMDDYIHGGEFVVLTNPSVTGDDEKLMSLVRRMHRHDISALGINEGQISAKLLKYCEKENIPLFELPEKFALIDLSQILCQELVKEEYSQNNVEQLFSSMLDVEHLNRQAVLDQASYLGVNLSGKLAVVEFAFRYAENKDSSESPLEIGQNLRRIINNEYASFIKGKMLILPQTGSVLALIPTEKITKEQQTEICRRIIDRAEERFGVRIDAGIGSECEYLEEVVVSRREAAEALKITSVFIEDARVHFYEDQGIYTLISRIPQGRFLDDFVEHHIGKLIRYDEMQDGHLCETLENYLAHNCNAMETAEAMFLHRNTLRYRLNKIRSLIDKDLDQLDVCLELWMAFMIKRYRNGSVVHGAQ
ncbi:PucR C-terminal helix-turn-helix domain-containing protein [Lachnospiraceae bacterium]|nr:PucR C-terminal helix-turn-helix domain-containing protein [Lachnospiraceae bacterium]